MKKLLPLAIVSLLIWSCNKPMSPAKTTTATTTTTTTDSVAVTATAPDMVAGKQTYEAKCGKCHALPEPSAFTVERWPGIVSWMAPKARLDETEKQNVLAYVKANAKKS